MTWADRRDAVLRWTRGQSILVWLAIAAAPAFSVTALVTGAHAREQRGHAASWQVRGAAALTEGRADDAVRAFRNALRFAPDDRALRERLAGSLAAAGRIPEARAYLLELWQRQPGNGTVNLELARLAARDGSVPDATRYYHNAIEGAWPEAAEDRRRASRLELAEFLVMRGENELAQAELIALAADLPPDPALRIRVASLLADADAHRRALPIFEQVLKADPASRAALAGAGTAAFHLEDYRAAAAYLRRAVTAGADGDAALMLETSRFVLDLDPYRRGLPARERAARALRLLRVARTRLASCIGSTGDTPAIRDEVQTTLQRSRPAVIARDPDRLDAVAALAFRAARAVDDRCGPPASPLERALHLLHTRYGESPP